MTFSILFWNIWADNQIKGVEGSGALLSELKRIVETYSPDFVGLNEVMQHVQSKSPFVSDYLKYEFGYKYDFFAPASPYTKDWLIGAGLYSRINFITVTDVAISKDTPAKRRGFPDKIVKAIVASFKLSKSYSLNIIVAHPMHLRPHTLKDHYAATANLEKLIRSDNYSDNTILGGDFNEPGFMPKAFRSKVNDVMNYRTGSKANPTWTHNAKPLTPIRANLDYLYWTKNSDFKLKDFKVLKSNISDHRPIFAIFEYN